jgi:hypothetical protein
MEKWFRWLLLGYLLIAAAARIYFDFLFNFISIAIKQPPYWAEIKIIAAFFAISGWLYLISLDQKTGKNDFKSWWWFE